MRGNGVLLASVATAFGATICCLPALLFLMMGSSVAALSFLSEFAELRIPLTIISLGLLLFSGFKFFGKKSCSLQNKKRNILLYLLATFFVILILFYPEILNLYLEYMQ